MVYNEILDNNKNEWIRFLCVNMSNFWWYNVDWENLIVECYKYCEIIYCKLKIYKIIFYIIYEFVCNKMLI